MVSLEALSWLRAIGAAYVQIGNGGEVLAHSVPFGYDGLPIRRAQALAVTNGLDLDCNSFASLTPPLSTRFSASAVAFLPRRFGGMLAG